MATPKPRPTHLRVLAGNPSKRPINENEPKPVKTNRAPPPPKHLCNEGKKFWRKTAKQLHACGLLTTVDTDALGLYVDAHMRWLDAKAQIDKYGLIVKTKNGFPQQSPYLNVMNKCFDQMIKLLAEFGMTPSSRSRVVVKKPEDDDMDSFLNG